MSAAKSSNQSPIKPYNYSSYQMHGTTRGTCKCNKFLPQLFNANKCQQCFNLKDAHSVEALAEFSKVFILLSSKNWSQIGMTY